MSVGLPPNLMDEGIPKTTLLVLDGFRRRFESSGIRTGIGSAWNFHYGIPFKEDLTENDTGVWLAPTSVNSDKNAPFAATRFVSEWVISLVTPDDGTDPRGFGLITSLRELGKALTLLTETMQDLSLDGTVDYVHEPDATFGIGTLAGGNRKVGIWTIRVTVEHPLQPLRCPP